MNMKQRLLDVKPSISSNRMMLINEAYQEYAGEPMTIFRAKVFAYILDRIPISIHEGDLLLGVQNSRIRSADVYPEYSANWLKNGGIDHLETREIDPLTVDPEDKKRIMERLDWWEGKSLEERTLQFMSDDVMLGREAGMITVGIRANGTGKVVPDYKLLMSRGLREYVRICQAKIDSIQEFTCENQEKIDFWNASIIATEAIIRYSRRYATLAEKMAGEEKDAKRKDELLRMANISRRVPEFPPQSFYEAMQFLWFCYHLVYVESNSTANSLGRFDVNLGQYYIADREKGKITYDEAKELIQCLVIKCTEMIQLRSDDYSRYYGGYPLWQTLIIGGVGLDGEDVTNPLTMLALDAASEIKMPDPNFCLRVHEGTPKELYRKACEMVQDGQANPAFFGEKCAIATVLNKGGTLEEARDWTILGCIEPHPGLGSTDGIPSAGYLNLPKCLDLVLHNGYDEITGKKIGPETRPIEEITSFEELLEQVKLHIDYWFGLICKGFNQVISYHGTHYPVIYCSMVMDGCIDKGKAVQAGGAKHSYSGAFPVGTGTLTDCLAALKKFVFESKTFSMKQVIDAVDNNFASAETMRLALLNKAPKYGNDDMYADGIYRDLLKYMCDCLQTRTDARGGPYCLCNQTQTTNIQMGAITKATPDGRLANTPFGDNAGPVMGRDTKGPTASINSISKNIDQTFVLDGSLINMRFDPSGIQGEKGLEILESCIRQYVDNNGFHIQINVVDDKTLRAAQEHPEEYRDIVVRVAGYMAYFTELDRNIQDAVIARTSHLKDA